mmetsp:Transcript_16993/g.24003  ORF Transcript_16993/g.24003 Transcript_16993/m.24003 type:complete len:740 (+) Transcript_16993:138-2357(+)
MTTPEQELLDESAQRILHSLATNNAEEHSTDRQLSVAGSIHDNTASENTASDSDGLQGGQNWTSYPTKSPSLTPTLSPSSSPTFQPTLRGIPKTVRGMMWYDANGNGVRDSNVVRGEFADVEYKFGVGGVNMMLRECDWDTKMPVPGSFAGATTKSAGYGARGEPMIVNHDLGGGIYQFTNVQLEKAYYVEATAPSGFNLTSGICNDDLVNQGLLDESWACDNAAAYTTGSSGVGSVNTGRSRECIYVDRTGNVTGVINLGVMQIGDSTPLSTNVALLLNFDNGASAGRRHLEELISRATKVSTPDEEAESGYHRYLLSEFDRKTIGTVTAEVVAGNLDTRLEANGVELDAVIADDVMLGVKEDGTNNELAVAMQVHGHYEPPPVLDFDYIVQDSINRDTDNIRRSLREYNDNCRDQTGKVVNQGFSVEDFAEIHSVNGALKNRVKGKNSPRPMGGVFRQSCSENNILPSYFETSLKELKARKVSEVKAELYGDVYVASENRGLASWAIGPVAGFAGMIALLMGVFVFRRALGPRYADKYQEANKTEKVDIDSTAKFVLDQIAKDKEAKRKSRGGGGDDDDSVDSAFYSDADEGEFDETDKERKMRRKKKEYEQAAAASSGGGGGRRKQGNRRSKLTASMKELNRSLTKKTRTSEKLSARHGSEDTDEKTSSEEGGSRERQRRSSTTGNNRKSKTEGGSERRKSSEKGERRRSSAASSSSRRGRSSRSGGDNANASSIV